MRWNWAHFTASPFITLWDTEEVTGLCNPIFSSVKKGWLNEVMDGRGPGQGPALYEQLSGAAVGVLMRAVKRASSVSSCPPGCHLKGFASPRRFLKRGLVIQEEIWSTG